MKSRIVSASATSRSSANHDVMLPPPRFSPSFVN